MKLKLLKPPPLFCKPPRRLHLAKHNAAANNINATCVWFMVMVYQQPYM